MSDALVLRPVVAAQEVRAAVQAMEQAFRLGATFTDQYTIGFQGGNAEAEIHWVAPLKVWALFDSLSNRYWNAFGVERPGGDAALAVTVEANVPLRGVERRVAGVIGKNPSTGALYLLHRGRIGGGRKGVGAEQFWKRFRGGVALEDAPGEETRRVVIVGQIGSPDFLRDVAAFVHEVSRIKQAARE